MYRRHDRGLGVGGMVPHAGQASAVNILAIDPGKKPGFAASDGRVTSALIEAAAWRLGWDEVLVEDQFLTRYAYRNGRRQRVSPRSQISLIRTAERLLLAFPATRRYRIAPAAWRAVLWPGATRLAKAPVLARLRRDEPELLDGHTDDAVEARGILRAWLKLTAKQKESFRAA